LILGDTKEVIHGQGQKVPAKPIVKHSKRDP
jgi:hypothetical protein